MAEDTLTKAEITALVDGRLKTAIEQIGFALPLLLNEWSDGPITGVEKNFDEIVVGIRDDCGRVDDRFGDALIEGVVNRLKEFRSIYLEHADEHSEPVAGGNNKVAPSGTEKSISVSLNPDELKRMIDRRAYEVVGILMKGAIKEVTHHVPRIIDGWPERGGSAKELLADLELQLQRDEDAGRQFGAALMGNLRATIQGLINAGIGVSPKRAPIRKIKPKVSGGGTSE